VHKFVHGVHVECLSASSWFCPSFSQLPSSWPSPNTADSAKIVVQRGRTSPSLEDGYSGIGVNRGPTQALVGWAFHPRGTVIDRGGSRCVARATMSFKVVLGSQATSRCQGLRSLHWQAPRGAGGYAVCNCAGVWG
jgi:hypothetical protein